MIIKLQGDEITIDEIGEINDHIQAEAGHSANIIMGVGEDDSLGDAISVTIIATGFNPEQQDDIVNVETKKIIHTLEEEQKAQQDLMPEATVNIPPVSVEPQPFAEPHKIIHTLDLDEIDEDKNLFTNTIHKERQEIATEEVKVEMPKETHNTLDDVNEVNVVDTKEVIIEKVEEPSAQLKMDIIPTTDFLRNMDVVYDEVIAQPEVDFEIIDTTVREQPQEVEKKTQDDDGMLFFDMPLTSEEPITNEITKQEDHKVLFKLYQ